METLVHQLEEFYRSFWGGLILFCGVLLMIVVANYHAIKLWNLFVILVSLWMGSSFVLWLFQFGHPLFGLLAVIGMMQALGVFIAMLWQRRQHIKEKGD
jgi:hypothetical protein